MKCIWCREREVTRDIFCQQCFDDLEVWDKVCLGNTYAAACMRLTKEVITFKASLPRWLKWIVRV
jgi:hypothetical protein